MDRSVDSIGSCSLDVDADSTDFSDTSGSLNLATPSSAKDITREFTSRIKERCQISQINCQQTTTILDPQSGKITTIITSTPDTPDTSPAKKPSYLNLACCVNGYSNLTTYDSKLRQNINKSREVSPIRPSTNSLQYCKAFGNLLAPPPIVPMPVYNRNITTTRISSKSPSYNDTMTDNNKTTVYNSQEKTVIKTITTTQQSHERNVDVTDNVNGTTHFRSSKYYNSVLISPTTTTIDATVKQNEIKATETTAKSFIQQRVERLYGPGALAQGFYSPKKTPRSTYENTILCERLRNAQNQYSNNTNNLLLNINKTNQNSKDYCLDNNYHHQINQLNNYKTLNTHTSNNTINNKITATTTAKQNDEIEDFENINNCEDLPVLRHLRPEFRAQLPILSPKRSPQLQQQQQQQQTATNKNLINNLLDNNGSNKTTTKSNTVLTNGTTNKIFTSSATIIKNSSTSSTTTTTAQTVVQQQQQQQHYLNGNDKLLIHQQKQNQFQQQHQLPLQDQQQLHQDIQINDNNRTNRITTKNCDVNLSSSLSVSKDNSSSLVKKVVVVTDKIKPSSSLSLESASNDYDNIKISISKGNSGIQTVVDCEKDKNPKSAVKNQNDKVDVVSAATEMMAATTTSPASATAVANEKMNLTKVSNNNSIIRDGHYFLQLLKTEQNRLLDLAAKTEKEIEILSTNSEISDEIFGYLRSASGKARLLVSQKMKQFEGLCNNNLNQVPGEKFPTTVEDLQGFWDMVMLQVNHVDSLFKEIENLKANNWKKPLQEEPNRPTGSKLVRRPNPRTATNASNAAGSSATAMTNGASSKKSTAAVASLAAQKREAQRKQLMELKRKNKQQQQQQQQREQQQNSNDTVEIFVSDNHQYNS